MSFFICLIHQAAKRENKLKDLLRNILSLSGVICSHAVSLWNSKSNTHGRQSSSGQRKCKQKFFFMSKEILCRATSADIK